MEAANIGLLHFLINLISVLQLAKLKNYKQIERMSLQHRIQAMSDCLVFWYKMLCCSD